MNVLIIDNYDSFTFNLYQYVGEILTSLESTAYHQKQQNQTNSPVHPNSTHPNSMHSTPMHSKNSVLVKRNDEITLADIKAINPDRIIISPGPGSPDDPTYFGICSDVICNLGQTIPILGVCLGMQGIAHVFGGDVVLAGVPMHGKTSPIRHDGKGIYHGLPQNIEIMRYHSLMVKAETLPKCLEVTSIVANEAYQKQSLNDCVKNGEEIMGIRHKDYPIEGVQFHPESFATEGAKRLLSNFLLQV